MDQDWLQAPNPPLDPTLRIAQARRATEFLDRALVLAGVSVWRIDLATRRIHFNAVGFQVMAMDQDPAGLDLDAMRDTIHPDDRAAVLAGAQEALANDRVVDVVARYRNRDGSWRTLLTRRVAERDAHGLAIGLAGISLDWSKQLADRERADALADQARLASEALGVGFWSRDLQTDIVVWDEGMHRLYQRDRELGALSVADWLLQCVDPLDRARVARAIEQADRGTEPLSEMHFRVLRPGGEECWAQSWACRTLRHGRRMSYGMQLEVTEHLRAATLRAEKQQLENASREKSAFMARMSHDLRTPMNAVLGFAQLLNSDLEEPLSPRQRHRLAQISQAGQRLMALIDDLLATAHREMESLSTEPAPGLHVLCVEDNPVNLQLVCELMALRPGVRLRTAVDGLSGLAAALSDPPELLLLDLQLPDIDGMEVMRRLRAEPSMQGCLIVALSADAMPDHIAAAREAGFDDYWTKPIEFDNFLAQIDRLAGGRRAQTQG